MINSLLGSVSSFKLIIGGGEGGGRGAPPQSLILQKCVLDYTIVLSVVNFSHFQRFLQESIRLIKILTFSNLYTMLRYHDGLFALGGPGMSNWIYFQHNIALKAGSHYPIFGSDFYSDSKKLMT